MLDGTAHEGIVIVTADRMKLASVARQHKWGTISEDPDRSITFLAWHALFRLGRFPGNFDQFVQESETVTAPEDVTPVDPTATTSRAEWSPPSL